jgi:hypothetical protein
MVLVLYGYETQSLTLREEHVLRVFENRVLRRKWRETGENFIMWSFITCTLHQ